MVHVQVNPPLLITLTLSCLMSLVTGHLIPTSHNSVQGQTEYFPQAEDRPAPFQYPTEAKSRSKRYPVHLDPNFSFGFKYQECPKSADGQTKFFCPFPHRKSGRFVCLEEWELCDGVKNCPDAADETPSNCLFYKVMQSQIYSIVAAQRERDEAERRARTLEELRQTFP